MILFSSNLSWIRLSYIEPLIGFESLQIPGIGLPDGLFSNKKSKFGYILEGLAKEYVVMYIL
jgi:hypothetical protein